MSYFSDRFGISRSDDDDWFDPILTTDTRLFVDPFLIFQDDDPHWRSAHDQLIEHFNTCFKLIAEGRPNRQSLAYKKAMALLQFPEPREFCLGYTEQGTRGAGGGRVYAELIAEAMEAAIDRGLVDLRHFEELGVLNEGIGPDRISDLTCNVLRPVFIAYTDTVIERHKLPTEKRKLGAAEFDKERLAWRSQQRLILINPVSDRPILLVPERFLRELPVLNADDWWENYEAEQLRNDLNYEVMGKVRKRDIVAAARAHPESVRSWSTSKEDTKVSPYNFERDPKGVWVWVQAARDFVASQPLALLVPQDEAQFIDVIDKIVAKFKLYIEQQGGWKLLWNDNRREKPEEAAQLLFRGIASGYCEANNIVIDREVNLGRGPVDFKFSNGYALRALLEVKKLHNGKFWNGLEEQLPSYMRSDECDLGWFLAIQYRELGSSRRWAKDAPTIVGRLAREEGLRLRTAMVDGRPKKSASRL